MADTIAGLRIQQTLGLITLFLHLITSLTISSTALLSLNLTSLPHDSTERKSNSPETAPRFWDCLEPAPPLRPTTFHDCIQIARNLDAVIPHATPTEELLFSPRAVADVHLPFYLRGGTCLLDLKGLKEDSWDVFSLSLLIAAIIDLATT